MVIVIYFNRNENINEIFYDIGEIKIIYFGFFICRVIVLFD